MKNNYRLFGYPAMISPIIFHSLYFWFGNDNNNKIDLIMVFSAFSLNNIYMENGNYSPTILLNEIHCYYCSIFIRLSDRKSQSSIITILNVSFHYIHNMFVCFFCGIKKPKHIKSILNIIFFPIFSIVCLLFFLVVFHTEFLSSQLYAMFSFFFC